MNAPFQNPPPRKRGKKTTVGIVLISLGVVVAALLLILLGGALATPGKGPTTDGQLNASGATVTPTPAAHATNVARVGTALTSGNWQITVNTISTNQGDGQFNIPKSDNLFLDIGITLKNMDAATQTASSLAMWTLRDAAGNSYQENITVANAPDGNVLSGQQLRSVLEFEVPKNVHQFTLQFNPGFDASQVVTWQITA